MKHVVLVEDHKDIRRSLDSILRSKGYKVTTAPDAEQAAALVFDCKPDAVVLDIHLPGEWGDKFGARLKKECPDTKIIFITAAHDAGPLARSVPGAKILRKPFEYSYLHAALEN